MGYSSHLFLPIFTAFFLTAIFLGTFANPVVADSTGFLSLINNYRTQNGLAALTEDQNLTNAACWMASDLATNNPLFEREEPDDPHIDSQGRQMGQRLTDFGVSGSKAENLHYNSYGSTASYAFDGWKNSSGHNTTMLNSVYTRIGIGRANYNGKWYWVTDFSNAGATAMTSQCGVSTAPPPPPPTPPATKTPPLPSTPPPAEPSPTVEPPIATNSATKSARLLRINSPEKPKTPTLVQGVAASMIVFGNLAIFGVVVARLYRKHDLFK